MSVHCPDCYVAVPHNARDGRCTRCRPSRRHSESRQRKTDFHEWARHHNRNTDREDT
jgi:hypothetical protein